MGPRADHGLPALLNYIWVADVASYEFERSARFNVWRMR